MKLLRQTKADSDTPVDIEFMEFVPRTHIKIRNEIKHKCINLKLFNKHRWTSVLPGDRGSPNYRIEVCHVDGKDWLPVNYDTFMLIPVEES